MPISKRKQNRRKGQQGFCNQPPYKQRFRDELAAKMALALWAGTKGVGDIYGPCPHCAGWHTRSKRRGKRGQL